MFIPSGPRATAVILRGHQVLLMERFKEAEHYFVFGGGTIEDGEDPVATVIREVAEEFNLIARSPQLLFELENGTRHEYWFLITDFEGDVQIGGPEKERMTDTNRYVPVWKAWSELEALTELVPEHGRLRIYQYLVEHHGPAML
ncbi:NUDIX domain-containing protein [Candidatus Gracilibacteria bacterium]|nr:NUDIX domain-containing protein [Candidatus Gracilibacteria bacterium]